MSKRVLLIAPYFPPKRRVGSIRPFRFVTYLKDFGWSPAIICLNEPHEQLTDQESEILKDIPIFEIEIPVKEVRDLDKKKRTNSFSLTNFVDNRFPLDTWLPVFLKDVKNIVEFGKQFQPDVVWSTSDPWSSNYIGKRIKEELDIPWVADFRDPWTLCNVRYEKRGWPGTFFDPRFEKGVMNYADFITFTAKATETKYENHYPEITRKTETIYNSFDQQFFTKNSAHEELALSGNTLNILFLGKFRSLSTAEDILQVLANIKRRNNIDSDRISVYSMADLQGKDLIKAKELEIISSFKVTERVPNENVIALMNNFDLLLLSTQPERDDIIPAKLYEYLIAEPPIFSLAPNDEVGEIVKSTGRGIHFRKNEREEAAEFIESMYKSEKSGKNIFANNSINDKEIQEFSAKNSTSKLVNIFENLINSD